MFLTPGFWASCIFCLCPALSGLRVWQVRDEQHQCSLGNLRIPLSQLLAREDMTLNQRFQLSNSGPNSSLKMKLALRVLSLQSGWGRVPGGCVAQGSDEQGLCSDADGSSVSRLLSRPQLFLTLSDESNQSFFCCFFDPLAQKVLLSGSIKFSATVKFSKVIQKGEFNKTLQDGRNYRKNKFCPK